MRKEEGKKREAGAGETVEGHGVFERDWWAPDSECGQVVKSQACVLSTLRFDFPALMLRAG